MAMSRASRALDALLREGGDEAEAIKNSSIQRMQLWRYRHGKGKPGAETLALLERLSAGRVPANGWEDDPIAGDEREPSPTGTD